uniref:Nonstructural protein n=1 Tax=Phylloscopus proregulus Ichthamaparvovirus TaxID=2794550 RepID=A0A8A4XDS2_9VIRU|nr:MAG: nonstructural protein [Phylloscopus proregulus Ichthamaparvovirus]
MSLTRKQFFVVRDKLKKCGKWNPMPKGNIDNRDFFEQLKTPKQLSINEFLQKTPTSKPMSKNDRVQNNDICIQSGSDSSDDECRKAPRQRKVNSKVHMEGENLFCKETLPNSPIPIFHQRGDTPIEIWEVERAFGDNAVSSRTRERMRVAAIPETAGSIRDNTIILRKDKATVFWDDLKNDSSYDCTQADFENYFQNYNSLAVVIRCLPDTSVTTKDLYELFESELNDPFAIISERSTEGVLHWHMIWFTSRRSDNGKRALQKIVQKLPNDVSIAVQATKSAKHFCRYLLKTPITLGVGNCAPLEKYMFSILKEDPVKPKVAVKQTEYPNEMIRDLITVMKEHNRFTYQELVHAAPEIMQKYLHKPNLESIINNCKVFLLKPNDVQITFDRILGKFDTIQDIFPIWLFLEYQGINPGDFLLDFWNVMFKVPKKINVLCLQGPSNTGKTTFIRPLASIMNFGEIVAGGQFMFQNCINKELLLWEEPLIGGDYAECCKRVFEGMTTQINIKFKAPQTLHRTPILITTNKDIWHYCDSDETAFRNRMFLYYVRLAGKIDKLKSGFIRKAHINFLNWLIKLELFVSDDNVNSLTDKQDTSTGKNVKTFCVECCGYKCFCEAVSDTEEPVKGKRKRSDLHLDFSKKPRVPLHEKLQDKPPSKYAYSEEIRDRRSECLGCSIVPVEDNTRDVEVLSHDLECLREYCKEYASLSKNYEEYEMNIIEDKDKILFEPSTVDQWMSVLKLGYNFAKASGFY